MGLVVLLLAVTPNHQSNPKPLHSRQDQHIITNPLQYNHPQITPKKITLKAKNPLTLKPTAPGPGHYDISPIIGSTKSKFTLGSKPTSTISTNPGPGEYQLNNSTMNKNYGVFCREPRENSFSTFTPGPGNYSIVATDRKRTPRTVYVYNQIWEGREDSISIH